ncbi:MAG TPA: hypothetical protein ENG13_04925 [bacterium]|nr:hypothetical protein [bacterium]HEX68389.1 hypothetical protein [bacterium]
MEDFIQEWKGVKGLSCVSKEGEYFSCRFVDRTGRVVEVKGISKISFQEFPNEPIPKIESIHVDISKERALVSHFPEVVGRATVIVANFKEPARVRKELFGLYIFKDD